MIRIKLIGGGAAGGFSVSGHSGYAEEGRDIICAAVSALTQAAVMGLDEIAGLKPDYVQGKGTSRCRVQRSGDPLKQSQAEAILGTMALGIQSIAAQYPEFIEVSQEEEESCF